MRDNVFIPDNFNWRITCILSFIATVSTLAIMLAVKLKTDPKVWDGSEWED